MIVRKVEVLKHENSAGDMDNPSDENPFRFDSGPVCREDHLKGSRNKPIDYEGQPSVPAAEKLLGDRIIVEESAFSAGGPDQGDPELFLPLSMRNQHIAQHCGDDCMFFFRPVQNKPDSAQNSVAQKLLGREVSAGCRGTAKPDSFRIEILYDGRFLPG